MVRLLFLVGLLNTPIFLQAVTVKRVAKCMGSRFEITAVASTDTAANAAIDAAYGEIERIEAMISSWRPDSYTSQVNRMAGQSPVVVPRELLQLVARAQKVSQLTEGAFDITFASYGRLWNFKADPPVLPSEDALAKAKVGVGFQHIELDRDQSSIFLRHPQTRLGFGAIGKGYAANRAVKVLKDSGLSAGLVNAGGDLLAFGVQEDGEPWQIVIANPRSRNQVFARLVIADQAVVTSGDYENYMVIDGKRYGHIINPKTGMPVEEVISATVFCPDAELADALATAVTVMGVERGMALINQLKHIEAVLIDADEEVHASNGIQAMMVTGEESL
jgi:thiamine biosynthesis lipoprotein